MEINSEDFPKREASDTVNEMTTAICRLGMGDEEGAAAFPRHFLGPPKVQLPYFSGDIREWKAFYTLFLGLVHENSNLSKGDKLHCLVGSLKGEASNMFEGLSISGDNYEVVWNALVERYEHSRVLVNAHMNDLLQWRDSEDETEKGFRSFFEKFDSSVKALRNLNLRDLEDSLLVYHALARLNPDIANQFVRSRPPGSGMPQYEELVEFVKQRIRALVAEKKRPSKYTEMLMSKYTSMRFALNEPGARQDLVTLCKFCRQEGHSLPDCMDFKDLSPKNRYLKIRKLMLCYNCFSADHGVKNCPWDHDCKSCTLKHNKLIHPEKGVKKLARFPP